MLKFKEDEYRNSMKLICEARVDAERAADELSKRGYKNIFFTAVGGSLAPMMAIGEMAKQITTLPVFIEQAAELLLRGHKSLGKDSVVVTMSKSGDTKETVEIAQWCKEQGITVVCLTKNPESPLAQSSEYLIPMRHENGVEYEYMLLYWLFFRMLNNNGDFDDSTCDVVSTLMMTTQTAKNLKESLEKLLNSDDMEEVTTDKGE